MKFRLVEDIELYYSDLEFEVSDGEYDWSCNAYGEKTVSKDVTYSADEGEIIDIILEQLEKNDPVFYYKLTKMSDEEFEAYFTEERLNKYIEKYEDLIYDRFIERAREYGAEHYYGD